MALRPWRPWLEELLRAANLRKPRKVSWIVRIKEFLGYDKNILCEPCVSAVKIVFNNMRELTIDFT